MPCLLIFLNLCVGFTQFFSASVSCGWVAWDLAFLGFFLLILYLNFFIAISSEAQLGVFINLLANLIFTYIYFIGELAQGIIKFK